MRGPADVSEKTNRGERAAGDTGEVIGAEFTGVLHAAQQGRVGAFERLWGDANPALIRYLRVVAVADADDIACESWVDVVRRLRSFEGDETEWRALVFSSARMHAEDESRRRVWDAMVEDDEVTAVVSEPLPPGEEPFEEDELEGGPGHGLRMALEAVRDLPPEQGEVLVLRRLALLPEEVVADLLGTDTASVHALEQQALDALGLDAELLAWALGAEPRPVELADQGTVVGVFRAMVPEQASPSSGVGASAAAGGARVIALPSPTWRARAGAVAAASAAVLGMGAISAAAYQGVLPDPVQNVMHVVIGAPEPTPQASTSSAAAKPHKARSSAAATKPQATTEAPVRVTPTHQVEMPPAMAQGLCRAWSQERSDGVVESKSNAFRSLVQAAGGTGVDRYCLDKGVRLKAVKTPEPKTTTNKPLVTATPPVIKSPPPPKTTTKVTPPTPTKTPGPTATTNVPTPPTTTVVPNPTATTTAGSGSGAGSNGGTGAGSGGSGSQGAANRPTDSPAAGNGQARGQG